MDQETDFPGPSHSQSDHYRRANNPRGLGRGRNRHRQIFDERSTQQDVNSSVVAQQTSSDHQNQRVNNYQSFKPEPSTSDHHENPAQHNNPRPKASRSSDGRGRGRRGGNQRIDNYRSSRRYNNNDNVNESRQMRGGRMRTNDIQNIAPPSQIDHTHVGDQNEMAPTASSSDPDAGRPVFHRRFLKDKNVIVEPRDSTTIIQSEISENQLKTNTFECMICCDNIHRSSGIWNCGSCYNIFHLRCAIEWCNKSIKSRNEAIANAQYPSLGGPSTNAMSNNNHATLSNSTGYSEYQTERVDSIEWPCPTCREILHTRPGQYRCFCGKVVRPEVNRHLTPHSCGQICGKKRPNVDCPHTCNAICHPGRCNPCQLTSKKTCHCGKVVRQVKCSAGVESCDEICGKSLNCGQHFCSKVCHAGSCGTCEVILTINCFCGDKRIQRRCDDVNRKNSKNSSEGFSCEKNCDKLLDCGKHNCDEQCHPGPNCPSCKFLSQNIKTCPCGSTQIKKSILAGRKSCTDPIPTCENKCNRLLVCGPEKNRHKCQKKCHFGSCPPCKLKTTVRCECSLSSRTIDCSSMYEKFVIGDQTCFRPIKYSYTCETRCNKPKNCGRHRCQNKCCKAYKENNFSSIHNCDQICNKKLPCGKHNCPEPCHLGQCGDCTNIGWEELRCNCGMSIMYPPIPCGAMPPVCHRPCRRAHSCGHPVKHECHNDNENCAACTVFVKKSCFCRAESKDSVYCYQAGYSCGRTCKKQLKCRQHQCQRVCHDGNCESPNERAVIICSQSCPVPRYICKHACSLSCHGKTPCPPSECRKIIEITCECGNRTDRIECCKLMKDVDNRNKVAMLSMNRQDQDSIIIDLSTKPSSNRERVGDSLSHKKLDCDDNCAIYKRNKALAEALEIAQPDLKPTSIFGEDPLRLLKEATAHDYKFVAATYNSLVKFIETAKKSDRRFIFMKFPPADKLRREVIHELAHHFSCSSESDGDEPFRHVIVRAYKNKSSAPDFNIEQLLPVAD